MPLTRAQAKGVDPPKPLVRRKRKPKTNTLSFKEIAADLQTAHDARNHAVDAPAQVAVPNATNNDAVDIPGQETRPNPAEAGKEAGETSARDTRPDAPMLRKTSTALTLLTRPRPLAKNRTNGGGDGPDLATDRFNLSHRTQPRQSQDRDSRREQPAYDTVPAVEDNEEPEYEFDDMPDTGYFDSKYILAMEEDEGQDPNDPFSPHANYSSPPVRRAPTPDSDDERPHSRRHSVDSPPRRVERPGSEARGVSEERSRSRRHSVDSPPRRVERPGSEARGVSEERSRSRRHSIALRADTARSTTSRTKSILAADPFAPSRRGCPTTTQPATVGLTLTQHRLAQSLPTIRRRFHGFIQSVWIPPTVATPGNTLDPPPRHRAESSHRRDDSAPLRRMDFTREDALTQRVMPPPLREKPVKRKQPDTDAGGMEPDSKRHRGVKEDPSPLHKLRFLVGDGKSSSFLAHLISPGYLDNWWTHPKSLLRYPMGNQIGYLGQSRLFVALLPIYIVVIIVVVTIPIRILPCVPHHRLSQSVRYGCPWSLLPSRYPRL
ncbi:hypothetical protein B0H13DRAFT_2375774 [Mycena leptocephala]|nr:hypothetical protein B0H13DRAFT_2375774 [Mycena leptocephala]